MNSGLHRFSGFAALALAGAVLASPAYADGMRGSMKDTPKPEERRCKLSANAALTTEYVFRGFSQTAEGAAVQGGFDVTCGIFYAGVWASNLDWTGTLAGFPTDVTGAGFDAHIEMDWYAGIKPVTGKITWDLGVIYYSYPNAVNPGLNVNYFELKVGGSAEIWKDGTLGVTVFYSPDYQLESGNVWTIETAFTQNLPKVGMFSPSFSALLGYQTATGGGTSVGGVTSYQNSFGNGDDEYFYWNAGITLGFHEKWSLDFRYWDTDIKNNNLFTGFCKGASFQCDERFVATLKFTY